LEGVVREMGGAIEGGSIGEMRRMHAVMEGRVRSFRVALEEFQLEADDEPPKPSPREESADQWETLQPSR
jgi:hypothetical protein